MMNGYIVKDDVLTMLNKKKEDWSRLRSKDQDVTQENFVENVIYTLEWVIKDIEKL